MPVYESYFERGELQFITTGPTVTDATLHTFPGLDTRPRNCLHPYGFPNSRKATTSEPAASDTYCWPLKL